ncbi:MAG: hypothetical protein C4523_04315 [Myxococcales bacterium]|nr:MAG: hypothetical protein C4523_04315 [Myxococcales bacterium]
MTRSVNSYYTIHENPYAVYKFDVSERTFEPIGEDYGELKGIVYADDPYSSDSYTQTKLYLWEDDHLNVLDFSFNPLETIPCAIEGRLLAFYAEHAHSFFSYVGSDGNEGSYTITLREFKITEEGKVSPILLHEIGIDAEEVTGMAADGFFLWILTDGEGSEAGKIFKLREK